ncbi:MAG TPA: CmcI family methyltransferase [Bryobacteraceae bacterium]|nr:CmcI family methyltransferase [Bryobacteraceae bacterium]
MPDTQGDVTRSDHNELGTCDPNAVLKAVERLRGSIEGKVLDEQGNIPTFFDNYVISSLEGIEKQVRDALPTEKFPGLMRLIEHFSEVTAGDRFVPWVERAAATRARMRLPWELTRVQIYAGQGVSRCLSWRDRPLFKSVFDFAVYPMLLQELRPATIIELGSGSGASAIWFADILRLFGIAGKVYSLDLLKPDIQDRDVIFIEGDANRIEAIARASGIDRAPHPWLVIEDAHVNTIRVMRYFTDIMDPGDYLVVEDSFNKLADLACFDREYGKWLRVDTRYTDFFGRNTVSGEDSIFIRV